MRHTARRIRGIQLFSKPASLRQPAVRSGTGSIPSSTAVSAAGRGCTHSTTADDGKDSLILVRSSDDRTAWLTPSAFRDPTPSDSSLSVLPVYVLQATINPIKLLSTSWTAYRPKHSNVLMLLTEIYHIILLLIILIVK